MANEGKAFVKGGLGCLVVFVAMAVLAVLFGGSARIDLGGFVILLVIGGLIGLLANWIYQKGRRDG
jgi:hypothetical protein